MKTHHAACRWLAGGFVMPLIVASLSISPPLRAQSTPIVMVHGLGGGPGNWNSVTSDLLSHFSVLALRPQLTSEVSLTTQGDELLGYLSGFSQVDSGNTIAVGHSNGGLVSRQAARTLSFRGVVTIGTPNSGAPIIGAISSALGFADGAVSAANDLFWLVAELWCYGPLYFDWCFTAAFAAQVASNYIIIPALLYDALMVRLPTGQLLAEDTPGSAYLAGLNSATNLGTEAALVRNRAGFVVTTQNYMVGGFLRLLESPWDANALAYDIAQAAGTAWTAADNLLAIREDMYWDWVYGAEMDWDLYYALEDWALAFYNAASYMFQYEYAWCAYVNYPNGCVSSDSFIPTWSQQYPGAQRNVAFPALWGHTFQTQDPEAIARVRTEVGLILQAP